MDGRKIFLAFTRVYSSIYPHYYYWAHNWIEGIGSSGGVLRSLGVEVDKIKIDPSDYVLHCFKHNDTVKYLDNPKCDKCFCHRQVSITDKNLGINHINIFPNPTTGELRITNYELRMGEPEIFDVMGRKQKVESGKQKTDDEIVIDISHLHSGIYFLKLNNQTFKIIRN
jgi:hypothetical protein